MFWSPLRSFGASPLPPTTDASQPIAAENERSEPSGFASFLAPWTTHHRPRCTILDFCRPDLTEVVKSAGHMPSVRSNSSGKHSCGLRYLELFLWLEDASCPHYTSWRFLYICIICIHDFAGRSAYFPLITGLNFIRTLQTQASHPP